MSSKWYDWHEKQMVQSVYESLIKNRLISQSRGQNVRRLEFEQPISNNRLDPPANIRVISVQNGYLGKSRSEGTLEWVYPNGVRAHVPREWIYPNRPPFHTQLQESM